MNKIIIREWDITCGDGCCYSYGIDVTVNDIELGTFDEMNREVLERVLKALKVDFEIKCIDDRE